MNRFTFFHFLGLFFLTILFTHNPAYAYFSEWQEANNTKARLVVAGYDEAVPDQVQMGVEIALEDDWHTYWRTPGEGGVPPRFELLQPKNIKQLQVHWPIPSRLINNYGEEEIVTYGYSNKVFFPLTAHIVDTSKPSKFKLWLDYAICKDICVPVSMELVGHVELGHADPEAKHLYKSAIKAVPESHPSSEMEIVETSLLNGEAKNYTLRVRAHHANKFSKPDMFVELKDPLIQAGQPIIDVQGMGKFVQITVPLNLLLPEHEPSLESIHMTLVDKGKGVSGEFSPTTITNHHQKLIPYWLILIFAFLGGVILNIMPCVLPVLSLKCMGVLRHHGRGKSLIETRQAFFITSLGIITSFILLAFITIGLRGLGHSVGWGFHFQEPEFLIALVIILTLFALSMIGNFSIHIPVWLERVIAPKAQAEQHKLEHFMTGVLATILATPCTAPFVGSAVSFALSQGSLDILAIFTIMGLGLALPYLMVSAFPKTVNILPAPGPWMEVTKKILGMLLFGTAIWLLWILANQLSIRIAIVLFLCTLLLKFVVHPRVKWLESKRVKLGLVIVVSAFMFILPNLMQKQEKSHHFYISKLWLPFEESKIQTYVDEGKTVVVDITAEWCVICKTNELLVLNRADVLDFLDKPNIILMRGDWTSKSDEITYFLQRQGRYGIPYTAVYGPKNPQGVILPGLLTREALYDAVNKVGSN